MAGIEARDVRKRFGTQEVLKGVSLTVMPGEFISLVGPSGCGKTTLMRIIAGLETANTGRICIGGVDVTDIRAADRDVAMVFQNYALYPHLSVRQNMAVPLMMRRLSALQRAPFLGRLVPGSADIRRAIHADVERTAEMLAISPYLDRKPAQLSGGQRQRVALGRAIVRQPQVFLMDEPLSNLDAALRVSTRAEIVALHRRVGASTVYVTHDQAEAMTMSDRVAVMMAGEILQIGTPEDIYGDPQDLRVATFIGSPAINTLPGRADADGLVEACGVRLAVHTPHRGALTVAIRPEDVAPDPHGIACTVVHVEFLGDSVLVHARTIAGEVPLLARLQPDRRGEARQGATVRLGFPSQRVLLFNREGRRLRAERVSRDALSANLAKPERIHG